MTAWLLRELLEATVAVLLVVGGTMKVRSTRLRWLALTLFLAAIPVSYLVLMNWDDVRGRATIMAQRYRTGPAPNLAVR